MRDSLHAVVTDLLAELRARSQETLWSSYPHGVALLRDIEDLADRLDSGDSEAERRLRLLFAPTGDLQEVALSSGWSDAYMRLADRVDAWFESRH